MIWHTEISDKELRKRIKQNEISFGGNLKPGIYGKLNCKSGKRMKRENRVFFRSDKEAINHGFRPCAHCIRNKYKKSLLSGKKSLKIDETLANVGS